MGLQSACSQDVENVRSYTVDPSRLHEIGSCRWRLLGSLTPRDAISLQRSIQPQDPGAGDAGKESERAAEDGTREPRPQHEADAHVAGRAEANGGQAGDGGLRGGNGPHGDEGTGA